MHAISLNNTCYCLPFKDSAHFLFEFLQTLHVFLCPSIGKKIFLHLEHFMMNWFEVASDVYECLLPLVFMYSKYALLSWLLPFKTFHNEKIWMSRFPCYDIISCRKNATIVAKMSRSSCIWTSNGGKNATFKNNTETEGGGLLTVSGRSKGGIIWCHY